MDLVWMLMRPIAGIAVAFGWLALGLLIDLKAGDGWATVYFVTAIVVVPATLLVASLTRKRR